MAENDFFGAEGKDAVSPQVSALLPWHVKTWSLLTSTIERLPHALMLSGPLGLGKGAFARRFAQFLLCLSPTAQQNPCGHCHSCKLYMSGTHPDFTLVAPVEIGRAIGVDQVRELNHFLSLKPHTASRKLVIIDPADAMNINASNALLKQLEEPPLDSVLVLVTSAPNRLPATIRSRCSSIAFLLPKPADAVKWVEAAGIPQNRARAALTLAGGAPLLAVELARENVDEMGDALLKDLESLAANRGEVVGCAARWKDLGTSRVLAWFQRALCEFIKSALGATDGRNAAKRDLFNRLQALGKHIQLRELFCFLDQVSNARSLLPGPLDEQLMIESLLVEWTRLPR